MKLTIIVRRLRLHLTNPHTSCLLQNNPMDEKEKEAITLNKKSDAAE
jgi:hypothetical protein